MATGTRPPIEERILPLLRLTAAEERRFSPWFRALVGQSQSEILARLAEHWAGVRAPWLRPLCDHLLDFTPTAITTVGGRAYSLRLDRMRPHPTPSEVRRNRAEHHLWLREPVLRADVDRLLRERRLLHRRSLQSFYHLFNGLGDTWPGTYAGFLPVKEWIRFGVDDWHRESVSSQWEGSFVFFRLGNGDEYILHPTGRVAFWSHEEPGLSEFATRFESFVERFTEAVSGFRELTPGLD
jgi:hypothetical protein